ncbi:hypothetical protein [Lacrimispora saccharolytica]|uniref:hypothetical protein n=1 Tax=Lacrimispora saccharolytica TaxID=84030 RepID=UPI00265D105C|nr:hypothetical protein [Lacrimispora saccharolytica]MCF2657008.1 hypothetical protein [Lacrimispora saccharolytica]
MAEPKGYELIQLKLKKTAAALRMSGGQLKEQQDSIRDLINTCEEFLSDETLSPMEALKKPLIANLIKLMAPTVGIPTESMPSTRNNSVEGAESDTNPIVADTLNPFSSLHISLEDATKDFNANGEEIYFINIEGRKFRIVEPECNDYNGIIDKYRKLLPTDLHDDMEKLRNYARFTAGEVDRLDRETMIGIADFEKRHVARRSQFPAMGDFAAEYRHALHIIKNPDALRYDRPAKRELNRCAYRALAMLLKLDELAPICLPATVHNASKTLTATLIEIPQGVVLTDLSPERRDALAIEKGTDVRFLIKISELQVLDYISGIAGRSGGNIMICSGDDTTSEVVLPGDANMTKLLALPTERMFGKLGDSVGGERSFGPANMRVITRGLKHSLDGLEKNMLELVLTPFGITEAELAAIRTRINNILDAVEHHQILVYDEKDWERSGLSDLAEYTENESGEKQCANVYAILEGN